ncbi:MAG: hypothetical protein IJJ85_04355 [Clostridia bacterium]|nr:hypothetical protein [Clostridia bacterium]
MKKGFVCVLSLLIVLTLFAACGKKERNDPTPTNNNPASDTLSVKTIGEALALKGEGEFQSATLGKAYVVVFEKDGVYWRVIAELTPEQHDAIFALDILDENHDEKEKELVSPLTVTKIENLNEKKLSDDDMAALVGKTGAELFGSGWTTGMGYDLESMEFYLEYAPFMYTVTFEKQEQLENTDDFDQEAAVASLKVVSVSFTGLGNSVTEIPEYSAE